MPLWNIYHPQALYTSEEKQAIAQRITGVYRMLPRFYVGVLFHELPRTAFFIGGEPADDFVRISVDHIARTFNDEQLKDAFLAAVGRLLAPFIEDRGLRWEMHVDETPFSLWTIQNLRPPAPNSEAEARWLNDNRPTPF